MFARDVKPPSRHLFLALLLLAATVFGVLVVFFSVREEYWGDEAFSVRRIEASWAQIYNPFAYVPAEDTDPFDARYVYDFNPPFYFGLIRAIAGPHPARLVLHMFSIVPALGVLVLLGAGVNRRFGLAAGVAVLAALTFSPAMLYYGHEVRPYALATLAATILVLLYQWPPARAGWVFAANAIVALLGCLTHYHVIWLIGALAAVHFVVALASPGTRRKSLAALAGLIAGGAATALIMWPVRHTITATTTLPNPPIRAIWMNMLLFPVMSASAMKATQLTLSLIVAILFLALLVWRFRPRQYAPWLTMWLIPSAGPIAANVLLGMAVQPRYAIFGLPGFIVLLGMIVGEAWRGPRLSRIAASALMVAMLVNGIYWTAPRMRQPFRTPWSPVIQNLYAREQAGDFYTIQPQWLTLAFVANAPAPPKSTYVANLKRIPPAAKRLWVIERFNPDRRPATQLAATGWKAEPVFPVGVYWLWLAQRP